MIRNAVWNERPAAAAQVEALSRALELEPPAARVLVSRGLSEPAAAKRFLLPRIDHLGDPFALRDMDRAAERLCRAIARREKILLYGDYDVDGTTSIVMLKKAIEMANGSASFHVPHRLRDGYGMRADVIERAAADGVTLIVSVDTGIRAGAVVERARALGIDTIVTDHHLPETELPPAFAVINPNRPDCGYPEKNLCGAGVTLKLVHALLLKLKWPAERVGRVLLSFLKLAAIATVADVVPLTGENRAIVKLGLEGLDQVRNPGLRALLRVAGIKPGDRPTATQVAFRVAPRINAAGRMASADDVIRMFLSEDGAEADAIADQLHDLNRERQETESGIAESILDAVEREPVTDQQCALVFSGAEWHKGVVGIVASRVVERFFRPAFVLAENPETGEATGSGRSVERFHLLEALESMADLFIRFGGHKQAAGLTLRLEKVPEFRQRLNEYAAARLKPEDFRAVLDIDAEISLPELNDRSVAQLLRLAPFGFGNREPLLVARGAEVAGPVTVMKEKHLRVPLRHGARTMSIKAWNFAPRAAELAPGTKLDAAIVIEEDAFAASQGLPGWSATLKDIRPAAGDQYRNNAAASA